MGNRRDRSDDGGKPPFRPAGGFSGKRGGRSSDDNPARPARRPFVRRSPDYKPDGERGRLYGQGQGRSAADEERGSIRPASTRPRPASSQKRYASDRPRPASGRDRQPGWRKPPGSQAAAIPAAVTPTAAVPVVPLPPDQPVNGGGDEARINPHVLEPGTGLPDRLEGRNPILEALRAGRAINKLWIAKREDKPDPALGRLISQAREAGAVIVEVDRRALDAMSTTHGHQGVIAQVAAHEYVEFAELIQSVKTRKSAPFLLVLDELQESYNLGSVLRIADAAGVDGIIIPLRRSVGLDAAVAKASAGAIEYVPVSRVGNLAQAVEKLKTEGFWIAGTDSDGKTDYRRADWQGPLAIVIGSEGEGLSPIMRRHCDFLVSIPMSGKVNSLNAAVAAGIVTFEAAAQRRQAAAGKSPVQPAVSSADPLPATQPVSSADPQPASEGNSHAAATDRSE